MAENLPREGWLKKKGFLGLFSDRFCYLLGSQLIVAKDEKKEHVEQTIDITPQTKIQVLTSEKNKPKFLVCPPSSKNEAVFEAKSYQEMMQWVLLLRGITFINPDINMDCFDIIATIGRGYYGKVRLVKTKETGEVLAIKSIRKSKLIAQNKVQSVLSERNIMAKTEHPFIVSLKFTFQSKSKFYFGLEYVPGGELFHRIYKGSFLSRQEYRLVIAQVAIALHHLHSIGVIYRDIKPENILIAADGYIKLADFGLAKDITVDELTSTFCGTPEYIAPEIVKGLNYDTMIDWWALGILTYELIYHRTPFRSRKKVADENENKSITYTNILQKEPRFPPDADPVEKEFITGLLRKDPKKRYSYKNVYNHQFFGGMTFEDVLAKKIVPEYIPRLDSTTSTQNFDEQFTGETKVESYVPPVFGDVADLPGFSYTSSNYLQQFSESSHSDSGDYNQQNSLLVPNVIQ